jgi:hypothetical protein
MDCACKEPSFARCQTCRKPLCLDCIDVHECPPPRGVAISVKPHPAHPDTHSLIRAEVRGRVLACTWAGIPTLEQARAAWRTGRRDFKAYDESAGVFLA